MRVRSILEGAFEDSVDDRFHRRESLHLGWISWTLLSPPQQRSLGSSNEPTIDGDLSIKAPFFDIAWGNEIPAVKRRATTEIVEAEPGMTGTNPPAIRGW
jgi:hypothetical protein